MRFPRFHFGTAIALGLSMLCMSVVPVFADGLTAPHLTASVTGSTVTLTWNITAGAPTFMLRRSTVAAPSTISDGTLVVSVSNTVTTYDDTNLANGTYYYSIFAVSGGLSSAPGSAGPVVIAVNSGDGGAPPWLRELRRQNGLDQWGYPLSSSSSSSASVASSSSSAPADLTVDIHPATTSSSSSSAPQQEKPAVTPLQEHTCERVMKWLSGKENAMARVNARLMKWLGFSCGG